MENNPLVTVNILSYNRKDELRNTLSKVFGQDYKNIEVIVVDNASSDGTREMVRSEYPDVVLIEMQKNVGISGWNEGFKTARGEYVLVLDDDSYPENNTIFNSFKYFTENVMIVALKVYNSSRGIIENQYNGECPCSFIGCGAMIKKIIFNRNIFYSHHYFLYHNELDFSARLLNQGFLIRYAEDTLVIHAMSVKNRNALSRLECSGDRYYWFFISYFIFVIHNIHLINALQLSFKWLINRFIIAFFYNYWKYFFKALIHLMKNITFYSQERRPISVEYEKYYLKMIPWIESDYFPNFKKPRIFE